MKLLKRDRKQVNNQQNGCEEKGYEDGRFPDLISENPMALIYRRVCAQTARTRIAVTIEWVGEMNNYERNQKKASLRSYRIF